MIAQRGENQVQSKCLTDRSANRVGVSHPEAVQGVYGGGDGLASTAIGGQGLLSGVW